MKEGGSYEKDNSENATKKKAGNIGSDRLGCETMAHNLLSRLILFVWIALINLKSKLVRILTNVIIMSNVIRLPCCQLWHLERKKTFTLAHGAQQCVFCVWDCVRVSGLFCMASRAKVTYCLLLYIHCLFLIFIMLPFNSSNLRLSVCGWIVAIYLVDFGLQDKLSWFLWISFPPIWSSANSHPPGVIRSSSSYCTSSITIGGKMVSHNAMWKADLPLEEEVSENQTWRQFFLVGRKPGETTRCRPSLTAA